MLYTLLLIGDERYRAPTPSIGPTPPVFDNNQFVHFVLVVGPYRHKGEGLLTEGCRFVSDSRLKLAQSGPIFEVREKGFAYKEGGRFREWVFGPSRPPMPIADAESFFAS